MRCINVKNTMQWNAVLIVKKQYAVKCCVLLLTTLRSEMLCINIKNTMQWNAVYYC